METPAPERIATPEGTNPAARRKSAGKLGCEEQADGAICRPAVPHLGDLVSMYICTKVQLREWFVKIVFI